MKVEARRCKYKKVTSKYETDNVLDIIDIEDTLSKNKFIPKAPILSSSQSPLFLTPIQSLLSMKARLIMEI